VLLWPALLHGGKDNKKKREFFILFCCNCVASAIGYKKGAKSLWPLLMCFSVLNEDSGQYLTIWNNMYRNKQA
jgi:hypothetical protein